MSAYSADECRDLPTQAEVDAWIAQYRDAGRLCVLVERVHSPDVVAVGVARSGESVAFVTDQAGALKLAVMLMHNAGVDTRGVVLESDVKKSALKRARGKR